MYKFSLQYERRPDGCFGILVGMWNLDSMSGKGEVCDELRKRIICVLFAEDEMERVGCWR